MLCVSAFGAGYFDLAYYLCSVLVTMTILKLFLVVGSKRILLFLTGVLNILIPVFVLMYRS